MPEEPPSLFEWAGGGDAIRRMIDAFYDRVEADDLLSPFFPGGVIPKDRVEREAVLWPPDEPTRFSVMDRVELIERRYAGYWNDLWCRVMDYVEAHRTEFAVPA